LAAGGALIGVNQELYFEMIATGIGSTFGAFISVLLFL